MSKLSETFSFFGFLGDVEADPGGRPHFLGATLVGVVGVAVAAESAKVVVVTETDFFAFCGWFQNRPGRGHSVDNLDKFTS